MLPNISIVVATYNAANTLPRLLDSIHAQTFKNYEVIVIDAGSTDGTVDLLRAHQDQLAYWVSEPDDGIYDAWNKGVRKAQGRWVCFIGADDYLYAPDVLEKMSEALAAVTPSVRVVYGQIVLVNASGEEMYRLGQPWHEIRRAFRGQMCVPHPGAMHRRDIFDERGLFDPEFRIAGDYEFLLRELLTREAGFVEGLVVVAMQVGGVSSDPTQSKKQLLEVRRAQIKNGIVRPPLNWLFAWLRVRLRLLLWHVLGETNARAMLDWGRIMRGLPPHWRKSN